MVIDHLESTLSVCQGHVIAKYNYQHLHSVVSCLLSLECSSMHPALVCQSKLISFYLIAWLNAQGILIPDNCTGKTLVAQFVPCFARPSHIFQRNINFQFIMTSDAILYLVISGFLTASSKFEKKNPPFVTGFVGVGHIQGGIFFQKTNFFPQL